MLTKTEEMEAEFHSPIACRDYLLSGKAQITLRSDLTNARITYRAEIAHDRRTGKEMWWVKAYSTKLGDFELVGILRDAEFETVPRARGSLAAKGFKYFWKHLAQGRYAPDLDVCHRGKCGKCGKQLKDAECLGNGFGPECIMRVRLTADVRRERLACEPVYVAPLTVPKPRPVPNVIKVNFGNRQAA